VLQGKVAVNSQEDNVTFSCLGNIKEFNFNLSVLGVDFASSTSLRSKDAELVDGQDATVFETISDFLANGTGGANDCYGVAHLQNS
jgi:hypothetical protein